LTGQRLAFSESIDTAAVHPSQAAAVHADPQVFMFITKEAIDG